ncbi:MAG: hypothetical protein CMF11_08365 [Idiomarina sp.]|nr:hypothetical protein [Idiomarina sp.]|tara:strand:- start:162 stop:410 length:249 start_codon:yes stop_codon:yes gene_type:complete
MIKGWFDFVIYINSLKNKHVYVEPLNANAFIKEFSKQFTGFLPLRLARKPSGKGILLLKSCCCQFELWGVMKNHFAARLIWF